MASQQAILEFERVFKGYPIDHFLNSNNHLDFSGLCATSTKLNTLIRLLEFNLEIIPEWSGVLIIDSNNIGVKSDKELMIERLDELRITHVNVCEKGGVKRLTRLLTCEKIHTLTLRDNQIGADGARDLATMLEKNTTIHTLDLHTNDIGAGVKDLATMLETNTTIHTLGCREYSHLIDAALTRNMTLFTKKDRDASRSALQYAVSTKNISAIESLLERHHGNLEIEKELVVSLWNIVTQYSPKQAQPATLKILVDLAIQSHASKLFPKVSQLDGVVLARLISNLDKVAFAHLLPHLDEAALTRSLPHLCKDAIAPLLLSHLNEAALAQVLSNLDEAALAQLLPRLDKAAAAQVLSHLDGAALAQLIPHLGEAALAHLRIDPRLEIRSIVEIALTPVNSSFDPSRLAQQLTALLAFPTDVFAEDGTPLPSIFLERSSANISTRLINLAAAAVRRLLERQHKHEIKTWVDAHPDSNTLMTALDVTKCAEKHLERYVDTTLDLQQTNPSLDRMVVPEWYDQVLVQPAVEAVRNQLEHRRVAALATTTQTDRCQKLAKENLEADRLLYGGALSKAQQQNRAATTKMELLAAQKEVQTQSTWTTNPDTGKRQRPTHPNMSASATVAQVMLQAVQQSGAFRKVIESMRVVTGLTLSIVKGTVDRHSGLLRKHTGVVQNQESSFYMSKGGYRIAQKLWVRGNVRSICDINRALFVADTFEDLFKAAEHIFSRSDIHIVDIKDRVNNPTYGGWSDLVLLFSVEGTSGHIHELQLVLKPMMVARGAMAAHEAYARARYFVEMLQKCDLQYDSESLESKQQKIIEKLNNVIENNVQEIGTQAKQIGTQAKQIEDEQKVIDTLKSPSLALCGWLQQAEGEKKKWKRRWFVLSDGLLTYHNSKVKRPLTTWERLKVAKGATPMVLCSIFLDNDPNEEHKFEIVNKTEGIHVHLDKSNKEEPPGETHTRTEWVDAMMSHTGCKMYTRTDWADTMLMT